MSDTTDPFEGQLDENDCFTDGPHKEAARASEEDEDTEAKQHDAIERLRGEEVSHDEVIRLWALSEAVKLSHGQPLFGDTVGRTEHVLQRAEKFEKYLRTGDVS